MTMLKTFDLKGNKLSFADWISNLSPCETPFVSMIPKETVDQTQYSWQTDRLAQPNKQASNPAGGGSDIDPDTQDIDKPTKNDEEGAKMASENRFHTKVHTNFTQIFRKAVRVSDTTKKISLYGRGSEFSYQMEKAGMEIKRDLEHAILNSVEKGRPGTAALHGVFDGFQNLVAGPGAKCWDTGAVVNKVSKYKPAANQRVEYFNKDNVFDLTYNLYLSGARANKIMFHPIHMGVFSDWIGNTNPKNGVGPAPHLHRMFDGLDTKYNALVKKIRDPLGQEFTLIPNRHMPINKLFFFNESDWSQMILRAPEKTTLAKMGSSDKQMIEMEVGLRHRNPFASGILTLVEDTKKLVDIVDVTPSNVDADGANVVVVKVKVSAADGAQGTAADTVTLTAVDEAGASVVDGNITMDAPAADANKFGAAFISKGEVKIKSEHAGKRVKVKAVAASLVSSIGGEDTATIDAFKSRD